MTSVINSLNVSANSAIQLITYNFTSAGASIGTISLCLYLVPFTKLLALLLPFPR